jgi:hypothetical protein
MGCLHRTWPSQLLKGPGPYWPFGPWEKETGDPPPFPAGGSPAESGHHWWQGVARKEAWTKWDLIRGFGRREAHQRIRSMVVCVDVEEAPVRGRRSGRGGRRSGRGGPPWRCGTHGEVRSVGVTPGFKAKTRCSSYVCPISSCHTYNQNLNTENRCLYYINIITQDLVFT